MRKTPTVLVRDEITRRYVTDEIDPRCAWVLAGEGVPTRKLDGTCTLLDADERWWTRREVKHGGERPRGFWEVAHDDTTGKTVGWEPAQHSGWWKHMVEAGAGRGFTAFNEGTHELIGPKVNRNPEHVASHVLIAHADAAIITDYYLDQVPLTVDGIKAAVRHGWDSQGWEGIVWHHPDGRMAKLKACDLPPFAVTLGA